MARKEEVKIMYWPRMVCWACIVIENYYYCYLWMANMWCMYVLWRYEIKTLIQFYNFSDKIYIFSGNVSIFLKLATPFIQVITGMSIIVNIYWRRVVNVNNSVYLNILIQLLTHMHKQYEYVMVKALGQPCTKLLAPIIFHTLKHWYQYTDLGI